MKDLIEKSIHWDSIGEHSSDEYRYEIIDASIAKDSGVLNITLRLNFVPPYLDMEKLKGMILHRIEKLRDVRFSYVYEDVILQQEEIIRLFIPHMIEIINGKYAAITKTIQADKFTYNGQTLSIFALGRLATEQLNEKVSRLFSGLLMEHFGISAEVVFKNDQDVYRKAAEDWRGSEEEDIKSSLREQIRKNQEAQAASPSKPAESSSFGGQKTGWRRREKEMPAEGNRIMGKPIVGESSPLTGLSADSGMVIIEGILFKKDSRPIKNEKKLVTLLITDKKTSVCLKAFCSNGKWEEIDSLLKNGDYIKVRGETEWDRYDNCLVVMMKDIEKGKRKVREDTYGAGKRVELHAHTKMSAMDGLNEVSNLVKTAAYWGQPAVAITDHGVVQSFPDAAKTAKNWRPTKKIPSTLRSYMVWKDTFSMTGTAEILTAPSIIKRSRPTTSSSWQRPRRD